MIKIGGIYNIGNTCYLNSALQCLFNDINFMICITKFENTNELIDVFIRLYNNRRVNDIIKLKQLLANRDDFFEGNNQQDCHEALLNIKDILHKIVISLSSPALIALQSVKLPVFKSKRLSEQEMSLSYKSYESYKKNFGYSFVNYLYSGQFVTIMKCLTCRTVRYSFEVFDELVVDIPSTQGPNIYDCLNNYCKWETLKDIDCDACSAANKKLTKTDVLKRTSIWNFPKKLTFVLNRFGPGQNQNQYQNHHQGQRNNTNVEINNTLEFTTPDQIYNYNLKSVVHHLGSSMNRGHYVVDVYEKDSNGSKVLYRIDDDVVVPLNEEWLNSHNHSHNHSSSAYIVVYDDVRLDQ